MAASVTPDSKSGREPLEMIGLPPKSRPDLLPASSLLEAGMALAGRTDRDGDEPGYWTIPIEKYRASLMRHVLQYYAGEEVDVDSGLHHLAHVVTNAAILLAKERRGT